jgi:hypothetical protein
LPVKPPAEDDLALVELFAPTSPRYLYRYLSVDGEREGWAADLVGKGKLFLSSPLTFNDPFDCLPRLQIPKSRAAREIRIRADHRRVQGAPSAITRLSKNQQLTMPAAKFRAFAEESFRSIVGEMGVACFSERWDDVLMWSHYSGCHRGICVRFDCRSWPPMPGRELLLKVAYSDDRPELWFPSHPGIDRTREIFKVLTTKARFWEREREWRLMSTGSARTTIDVPQGTIDEVLIGTNAASDLAQKIRSWNPRVSIKKTVIDPEHFRLAVDSTRL